MPLFLSLKREFFLFSKMPSSLTDDVDVRRLLGKYDYYRQDLDSNQDEKQVRNLEVLVN